jgi:hypothetical protein
MLQSGEKVQPVEKDFNEKLEASTNGLDDDMKAQLKSAFGDQVEFDAQDDTVRWKAGIVGPQPAPTAPIIPQPSPAQTTSADTLAGILSDLGLDADQPATASDMLDLREALKEDKPISAEKVIKYIKGAQPSGVLADDSITAAVQEFLDFIPPNVAARLPVLKLQVKNLSDAVGQYQAGGFYNLDRQRLLNDPVRLRRNIFHELMHWLHREGDQDFRDAIADHYEQRTQGERIVALRPYSSRGKKDRWYDLYAGTIYPFEDATAPGGLEVPTRYIEWLTLTPEQMAERWNDPDFRETMKIVLGGIF